MIEKDFWRNARVVVVGGGSWGTVLAQLAAQISDRRIVAAG